MSDYKRFVSYIYEYVDGEKRESAGFVKVNVRGEGCRIWVHMKGFYAHGQQPYRAYVCTGEKGKLLGYPLGILENQNGALEWNCDTKTDSLMESGLSLDSSRGLYIEGENRVFAAEWDDFPVDVMRFEPVEAEELDKEEELLNAAEVKTDTRKEQWSYLTGHFPAAQYMDGEALICSIRLSSRDLSRIPRDKWGLGNNSFLFHGFYQYQHLLLLRRQQGQQVQYFVAVPGVYNEKEQMMAALFGFREFKVLDEPRKMEGGFGYWCRNLDEAQMT